MTIADDQRNAAIACGLSVKPSVGKWFIYRPPSATPNYWTIESDDYTASGFSISGYIHDDDARLMTAAPDLKDGCNALLGLLQLICARDDVPPAIRHILMDNHRVDEARAAIAKAEGTDR